MLFLPTAYKICSKCYNNEEIQFSIDIFIENGYERFSGKLSKNYLNKQQTPPVTHKSNSEDTNNEVKLPWILIIGPELRN